MITKVDIFRHWCFEKGIRILLLELLTAVIVASGGYSVKWLVIAMVITTVLTLCGIIEKQKQTALLAWDALGQKLSTFPLNESQREICEPWAQQTLRELAEKVNCAFDAREHLRDAKKKLETKYVYGFRGVTNSPERKDVARDWKKLEEEYLRAQRLGKTAQGEYLRAWDVLTLCTESGGAGLGSEVVERFGDPDTFRHWVRDVFVVH